MKVKDLIDELNKLPPDDEPEIDYFHEDVPSKLVKCDLHDICVEYGPTHKTYLEIVGRNERW